MKDYRLVARISEAEIAEQVDRLAQEINRDHGGEPLLVIGILKGAWMFLADLTRRLAMPVEVDFVRLASYGLGSETSGEVRITKDLELPVRGRHVLVVEDIVDTGLTLEWYLRHLKHLDAASVKLCAFIDKYERREAEVPLDYVGIRVPEGFLVGYGLDFAEKHRNLGAIYEVEFLG
ncbi:MAG: hypoxanthine phosphoribosyltransferase [Syntrophobacteraceae bacterium]|jgi:hypoxanthine phosphoribosyltransferase|nr:hypoxanthine phosphoribosyltransferase [Syntrophobacteraceae bacterium]